MAKQAPVQLPDEKSAYYLEAGEGERYLFGTQLATIIAPARSTGNMFEIVILSGARSDAFPLHRHEHAHESIFLLDGNLELSLADRTCLLTTGSYVYIPAGTVHGYRMLSHRTRLLSFTTGSEVARLYSSLGRPYEGFEHPEKASDGDSAIDFAAGVEGSDVVFVEEGGAATQPQAVGESVVPDGVEPYILDEGEGIRLAAAEQLFTVLTTQKNTGGQYIAVMTEGPKGNAIIQHYHERHTEMFFCIAGQMTVWSNDVEMPFRAGDFLHIPANTVHSYRLDSHYTKFLGFLTPGLFEPFFHTIGDPYEPHIFPSVPGPFHFDRLVQGAQTGKLDLKVVGPPPDGSGPLEGPGQ